MNRKKEKRCFRESPWRENSWLAKTEISKMKISKRKKVNYRFDKIKIIS